jgi:glutamate synthase (NADPH/NADH) large chain
MSKMGISTYMSYTGAQIFEAVGLQKKLVDKYFTGTSTQVEGIGVFEVMEEAIRLHKQAFGDDPVLATMLDAGGEYAFRVRGEEHMWTPEAIAKLQHSTRTGNSYDTYKEYARADQRSDAAAHDLARPVRLQVRRRTAVPLDEVESAKEIVKRFTTGAMSLGSISTEAHTTLAIAMNRMGGKSNTGEGGEDPAPLRGHQRRRRWHPTSRQEPHRARLPVKPATACARRSSRSRRAASASRPSTWSADQIQIKMAQGAKPGEGGQLPGHKVSEYIGFLRFSVPGVGSHLAAAAPRHLLDRRPGAAHSRPEERQPEGLDQREAGVRSRRRYGRRGRHEGQGRPRGDRRPRRRHRRVAAVLDQARRHAVGTRPCRDAADAGAQPSARTRRACRSTAR